MGKSDGAVRVMLTRALDKLLEAIGPDHAKVADDDEGEEAIEWSPV